MNSNLYLTLISRITEDENYKTVTKNSLIVITFRIIETKN